MTLKSVSLLVILTLAGTVMLSVLLPRLMVATTMQAPNYAPPRGAINLDVTQANIGSTICVPGWTKTVRPPVAWTNNLKRVQMKQRHLSGTPADYSEDHFIPLELGGAPTDLRNLWPQPIVQARLKDKQETGLNHAVCAGRMTLGNAQQEIRNPQNWH